NANSLNDTNSSCSPTNSQKPCGDTFVTSTREVLRPSIADFINVVLCQLLRLGASLRLEAIGRMQFHSGFDPELCLTLCVLHMYVRPRFLSREEVEPKPLDTQDRRTHSPQQRPTTPP